MPSCATQLKLKLLLSKAANLHRQAEKLERAREVLVHRLSLLKAICDTFSDISTCQALQSSPHVLLNGELLACREQEEQLLSQLGADAALMGASSSRVVPRSDPMAFFTRCLAQPPVEGVEQYTAERVARLLAATVKEASIQLHLLQTNVLDVQAECMETLDRLWFGYFRVLMSLLMAGRQDVIEQVSLYDLETMQPDPDAPAKHVARMATVPPLLDLTPQQQQEFAAGAPLFQELLGSIVRQQQELQADMSAQESGPSSSSDHSSDSASTSTGTTSLHSLHRDLEGAQRSAARMHVLLHKEFGMRAAAVGWLLGCLDWRQVSKAAVLCWPYPVRASALALEIARYAQGQ